MQRQRAWPELILGGVLSAVPPYADEDAVEIYVVPHPYLRCGAGHMLWWGGSTAGASAFACPECHRILDARRVA